MKKKALILILSLAVAYFAMSQTFTVAVQSGYSIGHSATAGLNIGLNFKGFVIRSGFDTHLTDKVNDGVIIKNGIGYTFGKNDLEGGESFVNRLYFTPLIGHAYIYKSADRKDLNHSEYLYAAEIGYKFIFKEGRMGAFIATQKSGDYYITSAGLRGLF
jgi:hypothetical protein